MSQGLPSQSAAWRKARSLEALAGMVLAALGAAAAWLAWQMPIGSWDRMGPGFLPILAAAGLVFTALASLGSRTAAAPASGGSVARLAIAATGIVGFALLVDIAGGLLAGWLVSTAAALAAGLRLFAAVRWGSVLGAGVVLVFVHALDVPVPLWPPILAR